MQSLLYPAMQKFYSALSNLDKFNKDESFFENISSLDTFFSEFRNITFVLQKSLAHTNYMPVYETLRSKHLSDCKWFVTKRNQTTKEQPFPLTKEIKLTVYFPEKGLEISTMQFTVENDVDISTLITQFKQLFAEINPIEVFFSAKFSFFESGSSIDIYNEVITGTQKMKSFLKDMRLALRENCKLCDRLERKIEKFGFSIIPRDVFFITDYVYYPQNDEFERAFRLAMVLGKQKTTLARMPLNGFYNVISNYPGDTVFEKFVMLHISIRSSNLMPTLMIVYNDGTFELDSFHSDIKTTMYRKINEVADKIGDANVKEVYWMQTYIAYLPFDSESIVPSKDREKLAEKEFLVFMKVDNTLNEEEIVFDREHIHCMNYTIHQFKHSERKRLNFGKNNMMPVLKAFKKKREISQPIESV